MDWLERTPIAVVQAMSEMLPALQAEEALSTSGTVAVGTGSVKKEDAKRMMSEWRRVANRGEAPRGRVRLSPTQLPTIGIGYKVVKRGGSNSESGS